MDWTLARVVGKWACVCGLILPRTQVGLGQGKSTPYGPKSLSVYMSSLIAVLSKGKVVLRALGRFYLLFPPAFHLLGTQ